MMSSCHLWGSCLRVVLPGPGHHTSNLHAPVHQDPYLQETALRELAPHRSFATLGARLGKNLRYPRRPSSYCGGVLYIPRASLKHVCCVPGACGARLYTTMRLRKIGLPSCGVPALVGAAFARISVKVAPKRMRHGRERGLIPCFRAPR